VQEYEHFKRGTHSVQARTHCIYPLASTHGQHPRHPSLCAHNSVAEQCRSTWCLLKAFHAISTCNVKYSTIESGRSRALAIVAWIGDCMENDESIHTVLPGACSHAMMSAQPALFPEPLQTLLRQGHTASPRMRKLRCGLGQHPRHPSLRAHSSVAEQCRITYCLVRAFKLKRSLPLGKCRVPAIVACISECVENDECIHTVSSGACSHVITSTQLSLLPEPVRTGVFVPAWIFGKEAHPHRLTSCGLSCTPPRSAPES